VNTNDVRRASDSQDDARKDPATLEREIDQTRAEMDRTLGALERKLSPGQLLDQAMGYARDYGGEFASNLGDSIKTNPMPALLTAVGIAWMVASSNRPKAPKPYDVDEGFESDDIESTEFGETGDDQGAMSKTGRRVQAVAEGARQKLSSSRDAVGARMRRTSDTAQAQVRRAREGFKSLFEEQPLLIGALGIAVGAAIGAALPATEQENRLLGEMRDKSLSGLKERGAETYNRARDSASRMGEEAKQRIAQAGNQSSASGTTPR